MNTIYKLLVLCLVLFTSSVQGQHTFSIVAVDPATGEVGSAGATCLSSSDCGGCGGAVIISGVLPGRGAVNAQATVCLPNNNLNFLLTYLDSGQDPQTALSNILTFDGCSAGDTSNRQYGIVDLDSSSNPRSVSFTGSGALSFAGHRTGPDYSIQGNILIGSQVIDSMEARFLASSGDLCTRLMAALQGANIPGADSRCLADGISSKSSFIRVARPGDDPNNLWMDLIVPEVPAGVEPIDSLQSLFDQFKLQASLTPLIEEGYSVYPNPADHHLIIRRQQRFKEGSTLEIFNAQGKQVLQQKLTSEVLNHVSLEGLSSGIWLYRISDGKEWSQGGKFFRK